MVYRVIIGAIDKNKAKRGKEELGWGSLMKGRSEVIDHRNLELGDGMEALGRG